MRTLYMYPVACAGPAVPFRERGDTVTKTRVQCPEACEAGADPGMGSANPGVGTFLRNVLQSTKAFLLRPKRIKLGTRIHCGVCGGGGAMGTGALDLSL